MKNALLALVSLTLLSGPALAGRPIARWDVIPYQRVSSTFRAGVVAFHEKGVKVEFFVNGKSVATADRPAFNDRTRVHEHFFVFDAAKYPDGPVTFGATAVTDGEEPFKLPDLVLYANSGRKLGSRRVTWVDPVDGNDFAEGSKDAPFKTVKRAVGKAGDGGIVCLFPGNYSAKMIGGGLDRRYWTVLTPAPGVPREKVRFRGGRTGTEKIRFRNVELYCDVEDGYGAVVMGERGETMAWFDNCRIRNRKGRLAGSTVPFGNKLRAFVTDGETTDIGSGPAAEIVRNHRISRLAGDAFSGGNLLAVNCTVNGLEPSLDGMEPDFYKAFATGDKWISDVVLYNVTVTGCKGRAFSGTRFRDGAIVNVSVETETEPTVHPQFFGPVENVLFVNVTVKGQSWQWMTKKNGRDNFAPKDVRLYGVVCDGFSGYDTVDGAAGLTISSDYDILFFPKGEK